MFVEQIDEKDLNAAYYFIKKDGKLGIFYPKNGYYLNSEYQKIEVTSYSNQLIAIAEKEGKSSILDLSLKQILYDDEGILTPFFNAKKEFMFISNTKNSSSILNSKYKPVFSSTTKIEPISLNNDVNIILGYMIVSPQFSTVYSLNGTSKKIPGKVYNTIFDCAKKQYVLNVKKDEKYGLVTFNGETIVKPICEAPITSTSKLKYLLTISGKVVFK